jgi:imidazolonepropionase-like amidohydrolase
MKIRMLLVMLAAVAPLCVNAQMRAFTGATVIDGNGGEPIRNGVVLIDGKVIKAVGPASRVQIPSGAERFDVSGKYVLPGFIDGNVHLVPWPSWAYIEFLARYEDNFEGIAEEAGQIGLKHGFTTMFDSMGPLHPLIKVRDRINRGETEGPRLFVAGDIVGFRAVFTTLEAMKSATPAFQARINDLFELNGGQDLPWKSPEQIKAEMTKYVAEGADFVKFGATGDGKPVNSEIGQDAVLRFSPDQQRAMVEAVHAAGKIIQTHQTSAEALQVVVEAGVDMAQHCAHTGPSRIYEKTIKLMLQRKFYCGTQWAPLSEEVENNLQQGKFSGGGTDAENGRDGVDYGVENSVRLIKAGVPEFLSTDAGTIDPDVASDPKNYGGLGGQSSLIGEAEFVEMKAMHQRGMTPMMVIQVSTRNVAAAYHKLNQFGTLEPGKSADLVVLDADPLADVENMRSVSMVVKEGRTVNRAALPSNPVLTSREATNPGPVRMK